MLKSVKINCRGEGFILLVSQRSWILRSSSAKRSHNISCGEVRQDAHALVVLCHNRV